MYLKLSIVPSITSLAEVAVLETKLFCTAAVLSYILHKPYLITAINY
jgi:hypothetical protein